MGYKDMKELFTDAKNLLSGANDLQLKSILLDIQDRAFELQEENRSLRQEIHDLKNEKITKSNLELKNNAYYEIGKDVPYCTRCFDADNKLITMIKIIPAYSKTFSFKCPNCKYIYKTDLPHGKNTNY